MDYLVYQRTMEKIQLGFEDELLEFSKSRGIPLDVVVDILNAGRENIGMKKIKIDPENPKDRFRVIDCS